MTSEAFDRDAASNSGYLYTTNAGLSSYLANRRLTDAALAISDFQGKRVLDVGCGDGTYSLELFDRGQPQSMKGIDNAKQAVQIASTRSGARDISFELQTALSLPYPKDSFDLVHLRGILHHTKDPVAVLREALRVSPKLVVIEPNGYNPALKLLERFSSYHVKHQEKSFFPSILDKWIEGLGARVVSRNYLGLVPFFCPDPLAKMLKFIEPAVEHTPLLKNLSCAVYVFTAERF